MKIIGIDPGLSGAIAIMENNKVINIYEGQKHVNFCYTCDVRRKKK